MRRRSVTPARIPKPFSAALSSLVADDHAEDVRFVLNAFSRKSGGQHETEFTCAASDGRGRYLSACWVNRLEAPPVSAIIVSLRDLTEVRRAVSLQSALYRIAARASSVGEIDDFYASVHAIIGELLDAKNFFIAIYDAAADLIRFPYLVDASGDTPDPIPPGNTLTGIVLRTGQPLFVTEEVFNAMAARGEADLVGAPSADWLGVPLKVRGETVASSRCRATSPRTDTSNREEDPHVRRAARRGGARAEESGSGAPRSRSGTGSSSSETSPASSVPRSTAAARLQRRVRAHFGYGRARSSRPMPTTLTEPEARDDFVAQVRRTGSAVNAEILGRRSDGAPVWILQSVNLVAGSPGRPPVLEGTIVDITDRKRVESQIEHLAFHDALTGLPNRSLFDDRLEIALARCRRDGGQLAVLFLDLDRFKSINDTLGHEAGDRLLRPWRTPARLRPRGGHDRARGGDGSSSPPESATRRTAARRKILRSITSEPFSIPGASLHVTASIGVSVYRITGPTPGVSSVRRRCDVRRKAAGRNSCGMAVPESRSPAVPKIPRFVTAIGDRG
jgi:diguanylate cyclase (GGDEF)-like protein